MTQEDETVDSEAKVISDESENNDENPLKSMSIDDLIQIITDQNDQLSNYEEKLKHSLADFDNLRKKTMTDIQNGVNNQSDKLFLAFLEIYDDFLRAKEAYAVNNVDTTGLDSIVKNMNSFLSQHDITPIEALDQTFNPNLHEAISIISDPELDDDIITKEMRKGYVSNNRVIRVALVEISKRGT